MTGQTVSGNPPEKRSTDLAPTPFAEYAAFYDLLYRDKDYAGEAAFVARLLERFVPKPADATELLDLACGTGRHAQELVRMGYHVEGSDLSFDMVKIAADRAQRLGLPIRFHNESFQTADRIGRKFDAVIVMFAAIDYLTDYRDLCQSLSNIRGLLDADGVFIFDFWNGNAVVESYSPTRVKRAEDGGVAVTRTSNTAVDRTSQIATIDFDFVLENEGEIVREFSERHRIRYFFPDEMMDVLAANGYEVIHRCPFLADDVEITLHDWNLTYVARLVP